MDFTRMDLSHFAIHIVYIIFVIVSEHLILLQEWRIYMVGE